MHADLLKQGVSCQVESWTLVIVYRIAKNCSGRKNLPSPATFVFEKHSTEFIFTNMVEVTISSVAIITVIKKVQTSMDLTKNFSTTIHPTLFSFEISLYL